MVDRAAKLKHYSVAIVGALIAGATVSVLPLSLHVKLLTCMVVAGFLLFQAGEFWSRGIASRRRLFFIAVFMFPVAILASELLYAYADWMDARLTAPLRMATERDASRSLVRNPACGYQLAPSRQHHLWGGPATTDRNGFRSDYDVQIVKPEGVERLFLIGGSTVYGWGVPDDQDIASEIERMLQRELPSRRFEVINAGVPYYTAFQECNWYLNVIAAFDPDFVIVLDGWNDTHYAVKAGRDWATVQEGYTGETPFYTPGTQETGLNESHGVLGSIFMRSAAYRRLYAAVAQHGDAAGRSNSPSVQGPAAGETVDRRYIQQFVHYREGIARAADDRGILCILALQPTLFVEKPLSPEEETAVEGFGSGGDLIRMVWPQLRAAATKGDVAEAIRVDLTDLFRTFERRAYFDSCHYNAEANRMIAEALGRVLVRQCKVAEQK